MSFKHNSQTKNSNALKDNKKVFIPINSFKMKSKHIRLHSPALYKNKSMPSFIYNNKTSNKSKVHQISTNITAMSNSNIINKLNKSTISKEQNKTNNEFEPKKSPFYPKNFNEYRHLSNPFIKLKQSDINWSIELRGYPKLKYKTKEDMDEKYKNISPPYFYEEDLAKVKLKYKLNKAHKSKTNFNQTKHLTNSNGNHSVSLQQFNFYTTLREFKPNEGVFINNKEWKQYSGELKRPKTSFVKQGTKNEKYIIRPYTVMREKVQIGKDVIFRKKLIRNKNEAMDWFGEHNSCPDFVDKYNEKNYSKIHNYLCEGKRTVSQCLFELSLRGNYRKMYDYKYKNKNNQGKLSKLYYE